jgi:hypothetical protein
MRAAGFLAILLLGRGWASAAVPPAVTGEPGLLTIPVRFHVTQGATMTVKDRPMEVWVTPAQLAGPVIAEVNRIWAPARIRFVVERAEFEPLLRPEGFVDLLHRVENAARGEEETRGSGRTAAIAQLLDPAQRHPTAHNVYLLPYLGATYQGYAQLGGKQVVVGVWTDKPSGGKQPPVKALLVEPEPMRVGSLARTIAHELGHNLGLVHPDKAEAAEVGRLMGGGRQGYALTPAEIAVARETARKSAAGK